VTATSESNTNSNAVTSNVGITLSEASPTTPQPRTAVDQTLLARDHPSLPDDSRSKSRLEPHPNESWIRISPLSSREPTPSLDGCKSTSVDHSYFPPLPARDGSTPSPPPKSPRGLRATLKRFSSALPRTPSSRGSSVGPGTPSPTPRPPQPLPPIRKIKSPWPRAMQVNDVLAKKTTFERCVGYAQKINELYIYDCGLSDWLMERQRGKSLIYSLGCGN
jgi:hypothetical protein